MCYQSCSLLVSTYAWVCKLVYVYEQIGKIDNQQVVCIFLIVSSAIWKVLKTEDPYIVPMFAGCS